MKGGEVLSRAADLALGKKVTGTIFTALPSPSEMSRRYLVTTEKGILDVSLPRVYAGPGVLFGSYYEVTDIPEFQRGDHISTRLGSVKPWKDGQRP